MGRTFVQYDSCRHRAAIIAIVRVPVVKRQLTWREHCHFQAGANCKEIFSAIQAANQAAEQEGEAAFRVNAEILSERVAQTVGV